MEMKQYSWGPIILAAALLAGQAHAGVGTNVYTNSAHGSSTAGVDRSSLDERFNSPAAYLQYSRGNCAHCHEQHGSIEGISTGGLPALVFNDDTGTTSPGSASSAASRTLCSDCHDGTPVTPNVVAQLEKTYVHPTYQEYNKHTMSKLEMREDGAPFNPTQDRRHAECVDCHEPHTLSYWNAAIQNPFSDSTHTYRPLAADSADNNLASGVLRGSWGVYSAGEPNWTNANPSGGYTPLVEVETRYNDGTSDVPMREYHLCFKCHSYYALNDPDGITAYTGPSGQAVTDQGMEFNNFNGTGGSRATHPVKVGSNSQSRGFGAIPAAWMKSPWNTNPGTQTMYCSDCHGADDEMSGGATGPHGSNRRFMLKGQRQYWPANADGTLFNLNRLADAGTYGTDAAQLFCLNCHDSFPSSAPGSWRHNVHSQQHHTGANPDFGNGPEGAVCIACHGIIPHGTKRSRMIVYSSRAGGRYGTADAAPYTTYNGTEYAVIGGFSTPGAPGSNYGKRFCWTIDTGCGSSSDHTDFGGYEGD